MASTEGMANPAIRVRATRALVAASRQVERASPTTQVALLIIGFTVWRVMLALLVGPGTDESYAIAVSRRLELSYFDHPPLHYWITHAASLALGRGRADRLAFIALFAGTSWLMFVLTRRLFGAAAGVWACLGLNLSAFFSLAAGGWVLPDGPLDFCLMAAACVLAGAWFGPGPTREASRRDWLAAGLWIGLAGLSKYQAALFCLGLAVFLATTPIGRKELTRLGPYLAAVVTLAMISPVIIWNAEHGWASILFQAGRGAPDSHINPLGPLVTLAGEAGVLLPWIIAPLIVQGFGAIRDGPSSSRRWFCLCLAAPTILLFNVLPLLAPLGLPHWSMSGWLLLFPLLGSGMAEEFERRSWPRAWAIGGATFLLAAGAVYAADSQTGFIGVLSPVRLRYGDPTLESLDWRPLRGELFRRGLLGPPGIFIGALSWKEAGKLDLALGDVAPVVVLSHDPQQYGYIVDPKSLVGRDALIIDREDLVRDHMVELRPYFRAMSAPIRLELGRQHLGEIPITIIRAQDMLRPYPWRPLQTQ